MPEHAPRLAILASVVAADPAISPLRGVLAGLALGILLALNGDKAVHADA